MIDPKDNVPEPLQVYTFATPGGARNLVEQYLAPSVQRIGWELHDCTVGEGVAQYGEVAWLELMRRKAEAMLHAIESNLGRIILWADSDVLLLRAFDPTILLSDADVLAQEDDGTACAGLMLIRCNQPVRDLYQRICAAEHYYHPTAPPGSDQTAFNELSAGHIKVAHIDTRYFWTPGSRQSVSGWQGLSQISDLKPNDFPDTAYAIHANWCIGFDLKQKVLRLAAEHYKIDLYSHDPSCSCQKTKV